MNKHEHEEKNRKRMGFVNSVFQSLAIMDKSTQDSVTNVAIPSQFAVEDAKDWVDENDK